jgi:DNA-binding CsgD family transcriptional regulator
MRLAGEIDQPAVSSLPPVALALVAGGQGRLAEARGSLARALELSRELGIGSMETVAGWARGIVEMGAGEYEDAIAVLEPAGRYTLEQGLDEPGIGRWAQELAEAYIRVGRVRDAEATLAMLERQADATGRPLAHASSARCRGLLAGEDEFAAQFERALAAHAMVPCPLERARTDLCFGERLRRSGQRILARERLEQALVAFDALGAEPWGEHARRELAATGQRARRRTEDTADELTAQELQVALLVAAGATNKEAATALFLSPKTIETHLLRVYRKLGVHSRVRMARRLQADDRFRSLA